MPISLRLVHRESETSGAQLYLPKEKRIAESALRRRKAFGRKVLTGSEKL